MTTARMIFILFIIFILTVVTYAGESRLELKTHYSPALGINKDYYIYLPEGYDENTDEYYPVVYFFRGHESEWTDPQEDFSRNGRNIKTLTDQLYLQQQIGRMILVMPGTMIRENGFITSGINLNFPGLLGDTLGLGTGQYEDYFIKDLITHIDTTYRTIAKGTHRGTDGFSAGGWPALMSAVKHTDMFSSVGAYDGNLTFYLNLNDPAYPGILDAGVLFYPYFDPFYGPPPRDTREILNDSPANLIYDANDYNLSHLFRMQFLLHTVVESEDIGIRWMTPYIDDILELRGMDNFFNPPELTPSAAHNWFYADEHALVTLQLHWEKFQNPVDVLNVMVSNPGDGEEISGDVLLKWSPGVMLQSGRTDIFYSRTGDYPMQLLVSLESADSSYLWSTANLPDGTRYRLRFNVQGRTMTDGDTVIGVARTAGIFTINNPVNAVPEVELTSLVEAEQLSDEYQITWDAADADGEALTYAIEYSSDRGEHWQLLADQITQQSYTWQTGLYENSSVYRLAVHASDGQVAGSDTSDVFTVNNIRIPAADKRVTQISGYGTPEIQAFIIDPEQLKAGALYRIGFDDSTDNRKVFHVVNTTTSDTLITAGDQLDGLRESDMFDSIRLLISDYTQPEVDKEATGWESGDSNLDLKVYLPSVNIGGTIQDGLSYPADYRITVSDQPSDSTTFAFNIPSIAVYFSVYNVTGDREADFIFQDSNRDQKIGENDIIYLIEKNTENAFYLIWAITFTGPFNPVLPLAGDQALLTTFKPVTAQDIFEFEVINAITGENASQPVTYQLYHNYPNPFNPGTVISWQLAASSMVELKVYNILGQEVATLVSERQKAGYHQVEWDARHLASGVYYYMLKAGQFQEVKKMVLLR